MVLGTGSRSKRAVLKCCLVYARQICIMATRGRCSNSFVFGCKVHPAKALESVVGESRVNHSVWRADGNSCVATAAEWMLGVILKPFKKMGKADGQRDVLSWL